MHLIWRPVQNIRPDGYKLFDTLMVFLTEFLKKVVEINQQTTKKHPKIPIMQKLFITFFTKPRSKRISYSPKQYFYFLISQESICCAC